MDVDANKVFLVSGQMHQAKVGGRQGLGPGVEQRVVVANDQTAAYRLLATQEPGFKPVGHASLNDYVTTVHKLRAVLDGSSTEWKLHVG